jgi:hypothetical protein
MQVLGIIQKWLLSFLEGVATTVFAEEVKCTYVQSTVRLSAGKYCVITFYSQ